MVPQEALGATNQTFDISRRRFINVNKQTVAYAVKKPNMHKQFSSLNERC
jgi:hypothetical protein